MLFKFFRFCYSTFNYVYSISIYKISTHFRRITNCKHIHVLISLCECKHFQSVTKTKQINADAYRNNFSVAKLAVFVSILMHHYRDLFTTQVSHGSGDPLRVAKPNILYI